MLTSLKLVLTTELMLGSNQLKYPIDFETREVKVQKC